MICFPWDKRAHWLWLLFCWEFKHGHGKLLVIGWSSCSLFDLFRTTWMQWWGCAMMAWRVCYTSASSLSLLPVPLLSCFAPFPGHWDKSPAGQFVLRLTSLPWMPLVWMFSTYFCGIEHFFFAQIRGYFTAVANSAIKPEGLFLSFPFLFVVMCRERDYDDIDEEDPFNPRARRIGSQNPNHPNMHSFCSFSSSMGSQNSLHPPAPTVSNPPMSEYMWVGENVALFVAGVHFFNHLSCFMQSFFVVFAGTRQLSLVEIRGMRMCLWLDEAPHLPRCVGSQRPSLLYNVISLEAHHSLTQTLFVKLSFTTLKWQRTYNLIFSRNI